MNKFFFIAIIFAALAFAGCEKETSLANEQEETLKAAPRHNILFIEAGELSFCDPRFIGNCFPYEIVIIATPLPPQRSDQETFFKNLILENTTIFTKAEAHIITGLTNGTYSVEVKHNSSDGIYYVLILNQLGDVLLVVPYNLL